MRRVTEVAVGTVAEVAGRRVAGLAAESARYVVLPLHEQAMSKPYSHRRIQIDTYPPVRRYRAVKTSTLLSAVGALSA